MGEGSLKYKIGQQWLIAKWCIQSGLIVCQDVGEFLVRHRLYRFGKGFRLPTISERQPEKVSKDGFQAALNKTCQPSLPIPIPTNKQTAESTSFQPFCYLCQIERWGHAPFSGCLMLTIHLIVDNLFHHIRIVINHLHALGQIFQACEFGGAWHSNAAYCFVDGGFKFGGQRGF